MNLIDLMAAGFPLAIVILVLIGFYKVFVKKKSVQPFYTPFDEITGQSEVEFHEDKKSWLKMKFREIKRSRRRRKRIDSREPLLTNSILFVLN